MLLELTCPDAGQNNLERENCVPATRPLSPYAEIALRGAKKAWKRCCDDYRAYALNSGRVCRRPSTSICAPDFAQALQEVSALLGAHYPAQRASRTTTSCRMHRSFCNPRFSVRCFRRHAGERWDCEAALLHG